VAGLAACGGDAGARNEGEGLLSVVAEVAGVGAAIGEGDGRGIERGKKEVELSE